MITINGIKCREGVARIRKTYSQLALDEWYGEVEFTMPQKTIGDKDLRANYHGPLLGYKSKPIIISGTIYITKLNMDENKLITGIEFVGSGAPNSNGKQLIASSKRAQQSEVKI